MLKVKFWGVRGSIASPGPHTSGVGGNTSCVEVRAGRETIIFDAGTGLRALGNDLLNRRCKSAHLFLSHYHWDHIQGLPFLLPLYLQKLQLRIVGGSGQEPLEDVLRTQMQAPLFPVPYDELKSCVSVYELEPQTPMAVGDAWVRAVALDHPNGVYGYRVEYRGASVVYATDNEHSAPVSDAIVELARDADLFIYDSQYTPEEYRGDAGPPRKGWGHSTFEAGAEICTRANVQKYALFHHDPERTDEQVAVIEHRARALFPESYAAKEGLELRVRGRRKSLRENMERVA